MIGYGSKDAWYQATDASRVPMHITGIEITCSKYAATSNPKNSFQWAYTVCELRLNTHLF